MLAGLIIVVLVGFLVWFCTATKPGRACASWLQVVLSWLWLTRVSALALLALLLLPWIAHSCARSLLIGVYDLDGHDASGFYGALFSGLLLVFACWTVFVTAALTLSYGKDRTQFADEAPAWFAHRFRDLLWISLGLNVWTIIAATDPADRKTVALTLLLGLVVGLIVIWVIEEIHERINHYPMAAFHFLPHGQRNAHPLIKKENISENIILGPLQRLGRRMNELKLDAADIKKWRGYVMTEDVLPGNGLEIFPRGKHERSYVLPGHGLAILATAVFLLIYLLINSRIDPESHLTALVYLLILLITWVWVLAGATFFFDAHRLPVMLALAAWLFVAGWFPRSDHFYRIWPVRQTIADAEANALTAHVSAAELQESPLGPAEILADAQAKGRRIVLVAAAGGGIQSAAWTAKVLAELERESSAENPEEPGRFARSVQALSGVSGGSTGIMFFTEAYGPAGFSGPRTQEASRPYDKELLNRIINAARATSLGQTAWGLAYPDLFRANFPFFISGAFRDRAEAMEKAWAYNALEFMRSAGDSLADASLREWQADARTGRRPAVIFNSTIVETGERLSFSTAPSTRGVEGRCEFWAPENQDTKNPFARRFLYPGADIRITTAVRLSATFPFVSPIARPGVAKSRSDRLMIEPSESGVLKQNRWAAQMIPSSSRQLHVADGGYYENSGLSDLAEWLDRGLTELAQGPLKPPAEVLVIQIEGFPESKSEREDSQPHQTETLGFSQKGSFFQGAAPLITLNSVRGSGHTAFANHGFELLQHRWLIDKNAAVTIRHVRFVLPVITAAKKEAGKGGGWAPSWAEAKPEQPPLSWHLRGPEQQAIDEAWKTLVSERKKGFATLPPEEQESEWRETKSHPIDKVLHFLSVRPTQP